MVGWRGIGCGGRGTRTIWDVPGWNVLGGAILVGLGGCSLSTDNIEAGLAEAEIKRMTAAEIQDTHLGNSAEGITANGRAFRVYFAEDGNARANLDGDADTLTYNITDEDRICGTWTKWLGSEETCYTLYDEKDGIRFYDGTGGFRGQYVIKDGNPFDL